MLVNTDPDVPAALGVTAAAGGGSSVTAELSPSDGPGEGPCSAVGSMVAYMPMAERVARRYLGRGIAGDDLRQVAYMGLVKAARRFDPDRGDSFEAFARTTIRGELRRHFRDCGWVVRPPRQLQELQMQVWSAQEGLSERLGRPATTEEVAREVGAELRDVEEALALTGCFSTGSLDAPVGAATEATIQDYCGHEDPGYELVELRAALRAALRHLSERDRLILRLRFVDGYNQADIGREVGVCQMQVSRLLTRILRDLRRLMSDAAEAA